MTIRLLILITAAILLNCSGRTEVKTAEEINADQAKVDTLRSLYGNHTLHYFSNSAEKDTFKISVLGKSIVGGQIKFEIMDAKGQWVLNETFQAYNLIGYGLQSDATDEQKVAYIKNRIDAFFDEDNFHKPAIATDEPFDKSYSEKAIWEDIKSDHSSIGFHYLIGEEDGRNIAYSKTLKKTVIYFGCC